MALGFSSNPKWYRNLVTMVVAGFLTAAFAVSGTVGADALKQSLDELRLQARNGEASAALRALHELVEERPEIRSTAVFAIVELEEQLETGRIREAVQMLSAFVANESVARIERAQACLEGGKTLLRHELRKESIRLFWETGSRFPGSVQGREALVILGNLFLEDSDYEQAEAVLRRSLSGVVLSGPLADRAWAGLLRVASHRNDTEEVLRIWSEKPAAIKADGAAFMEVARTLWKTGKDNEGERQAWIAINLHPRVPGMNLFRLELAHRYLSRSEVSGYRLLIAGALETSEQAEDRVAMMAEAIARLSEVDATVRDSCVWWEGQPCLEYLLSLLTERQESAANTFHLLDDTARALEAQGLLKEALATRSAATRIDPMSPEYFKNIREANRLMSAEEEPVASVDRALFFLENQKTLEHIPIYPVDLVHLLSGFAHLGLFSDGADISLALARKYTDPRERDPILLNAADSLYLDGREDEALSIYEQVVRMGAQEGVDIASQRAVAARLKLGLTLEEGPAELFDPPSPWSRLFNGWALIAASDYEAAEIALVDAGNGTDDVTPGPESFTDWLIRAWFRLGKGLEQDGNMVAAGRAYDRVLELDPSSPTAEQARQRASRLQEDPLSGTDLAYRLSSIRSGLKRTQEALNSEEPSGDQIVE